MAAWLAQSADFQRLTTKTILIHFFIDGISLLCDSVYMKRLIETLMTRDGLSREEAEDQVTAFTSEMWMDVGQGGSLLNGKIRSQVSSAWSLISLKI